MQKPKLSISVFFPCYNDQKSIVLLVEKAFFILRKITTNYEVIVIDDCSTDRSRKVLIKLKERYPELKTIFHEKNQGYGGTLQTGFSASSKDLIFYTDGDGQYDVSELPLLLSLMTEDVNFINGIKMSRHDPTYRIIIGNLYSFFARWLFWLPIYDVDCDFRLIRKELLEKIKLSCKSGAVCIELIKKAQKKGAKFRQVSVHHLDRRFGNSQFFRADRIFFTIIELTKLWFKLIIFKNEN